jgi:hypothetical protein
MLNMQTEWMLGRLEMELRERRLARLGPTLAEIPRPPGLLRRLVDRVLAARRRVLAPAAPGPARRRARTRVAPLGRRRQARWRRCSGRRLVGIDRLCR